MSLTLATHGRTLQTVYNEVSDHWRCGRHFLAVSILGRQLADFKLIFGTISQLHVELCQHFANTLPSGGINLKILDTYLCRSYTMLAKLLICTHTHCARFSCVLCVVSHMRRPDLTLKGDKGRYTNE